MMAIYPLRKKVNTGACLAVLTLCSFVACVALTHTSASTRFYLMPYRAWEMLCGGLVWYAAKRYALSNNLRPVVALSGYALIMLSLMFLSTENAWPGFLTLIP